MNKSIDKVIENNIEYLMCSNRTLYFLYELQTRKYEYTKSKEDLQLLDYYKFELYKQAGEEEDEM